MKLSYYGYCFTETKTDKKTLMPISKFIKEFCKYDNPIYKAQFTHGGEYVFLLHVIGSLYLFVQTRSNEIIKKINYKTISVAEIYELFKSGETIGFASYVHINDTHIGFASTVFAPRANVFGEFINKILESTKNDKHSFTLIPLFHQASKADAMAMPFMGKSVIQVNKSNSLFDDIISFAGGSSTDFDDVDSLEITIKPKDKKDISKAVQKVLDALRDEGLEKLKVRAKDDAKGALIDLYLVGKGIISDTINTKDEKVIAQKIKEKIESNQLLKKKVAEHEQNDCFEKTDIDCIVKYHDASAWTSAFSALQSAGGTPDN